MSRGALRAMIVLPLVIAARSAGADSGAPPLDLEWSAPSECPSSAAVASEIDKILAASPKGAVRLHVAGTVSRLADDKWHVELELRGADWEARRALDGPSCAGVSEAAAVVIALAINPASEPPAAPPSKPEPPHEPAAPSKSPPFAGPAASVGAAADAGTLPRGAFGVEALFNWRFGSVRAELAATQFFEKSQSLADNADTGATFRLGAMNARGCYEIDVGRVAFGPCADAGLLWTRAQGFGPVTTHQVSSTTLAFGGGLGVRWRVSRFFVPFARAGALLPLSRPEYAVQGMGYLHRAAAVSLRGTVGIEVPFD